MTKNTKIEWADHTFNPWIGCTKVSPACDHCYAERDMASRLHVVQWGAGQPRKRTSARNWNDPLRWNAEAERLGIRYRVFCASLADVFDNEVPPAWRAELFALISMTPHLDWLLLTKRIGNVQKMIEAPGMDTRGLAPNVWLGATICDQAEADRDVPKLLATPAARRFVSMEPLLGPVDLEQACDIAERAVCAGTWDTMQEPQRCAAALRHGSVRLLDWVIVGGESGPHARPMHPEWARSLRGECVGAGVPFLFKQWGEWVPRSDCYHRFEDGTSCDQLDPGARRWPCVRLTERGHDGRDLAHAGEGDDAYMQRVGKKMAGRLLDGRTWDEVPA